MALRLILVGVVASLALDLPHGGTRPAIRSPLVVALRTSATDNNDANVTASETSRPRQHRKMLRDRMTAMVIDKTSPAQPIVPVPVPVEAEAVVASEKIAVAPVSAPALDPAPTSLPIMLPAPEVVSIAPLTIPTVSLASNELMPPPPFFEDVIAPVVAEAPIKLEDLDAGFRHVVNNMASVFAADLPIAITEPKTLLAKSEPVAAPAIPAEELAVEVSDLYPGVAFALNREAEGLTPIPMPPATEVAEVKAEPKPELAAMEPTPELVSVSVVEPSSSTENSRSERLSNAFKLTGQAVNAWAGLLSQRPTVSAMQR